MTRPNLLPRPHAAGSPRLQIQEVSVRDGFQIEPRLIPTARKIALIDRLSRAGLAKIEVTSFVSPKAIPQLADAEDVMRGIERVPGVVYAALVPNARGCERALACEVDEVNLVVSASSSHGLANLRMTPEESLARFPEVVALARAGGATVNVTLSTAFGCPFDGDVPVERVLQIAERCDDLEVDGLSLCDTTGMGNPRQVVSLLRAVCERVPRLAITAYFHNTRGMGLANAMAALSAGITRFDASLGGLGGCPFARGATGNISTEDLVHMFQAMGHDTGVDLDALLAAANELPDIVGHDVPGQVMKAGPSSRRYPLPGDVPCPA